MPLVYDDEAPAAAAPTLQYDDTPPPVTPAPAPSWGDRLHSFREGLDASTQGIVRGIPIVGPLLDKGVSAVASAGSPEAYSAIQSNADRIAAEHPVASAIGQTTGSVLSTVSAARAFPAAFGGSTFLGQTAAGAGLGGADAFVRSGGDTDAATRGAVIGAAGPLVGQVLAPIGQGLVSAGRAAKDYVPGVSKIFQPRILPSPAPEIEQAAEQGYQSLGAIAPYYRSSLNDLTDLIKRDLYAQSKSSSVGAVDTSRILDTLDTLPPNAASLHTVRKELNKVAGGDEGWSARFARDRIDQFLENPPPTAVVGGAPAAAQAGPILQDANANYRAAMQSNELRDRVAKAQLDAENSMNPLKFLAEGQAVRKQMKNWLTSDKQSRFLLPPEREAIADVGKGSLGERGLRMVGAVSGTARPGAFTAVTPLLTGVYSGLGPAAAGMAAGVVSNAAASALTRRAINQADNLIRSAAPYSQAMMARQLPPRLSMSPPVSQMPASISDSAHRDEIARLLALQAERATTPSD